MIRRNFNADWTVEKGSGDSRMNSFLGNAAVKTVHLPYDAMIHEARTPDTKNGAQTGFYPGGEYRRGRASRCRWCLRACTRRRWST